MPDYSIGGTLVAFHAQETMRRQLAMELGPLGIRVVTIVTNGTAETFPAEEREMVAGLMASQTMIGRSATLEDVGNVAVFVASDQARMMTASTVNISGGSEID